MSNEFESLATRLRANIKRQTETLESSKAQLAAVEKIISESKKK